jgi:hypothetical protein
MRSLSSLLVCASLLLADVLRADESPDAPSTVAPASSPSATAPSTPSALAKKVAALVQQKLVSPLSARDEKRSRFSRASIPPPERRVRVLDDATVVDGAGQAVVRFAIDTRRTDGEWHDAAMTGCVVGGVVYVDGIDGVVAAHALLGGKREDVAPGTCVVPRS